MVSNYHSTRSKAHECGAKRAVLDGLAPDGGLYVTDALDEKRIDLDALIEARRQTGADAEGYLGTARTVLGALLDDYTPEEMAACVQEAYGAWQAKMGDASVTPTVRVSDDWVLELFHGPTSAFKDVALQMLPRLMSRAAEGSDERIMILTATSGDTGKAALDGFADVPGIGICVFYPHGGTSEIQRLQMVTQAGSNVAVTAIRGNFDDAQSTVKRIFGDAGLEERLATRNITLSSANSINVGRLAPQVAYYFDAYAQLVMADAIEQGGPIDFCVPTGNFGDVLAGYYAKRMGLPVNRLIVASNANNVLTDFLTTGVYDRNRPFFKTISPSMDILISSNLERLLYYESGGDCELVARLMADLAETGRYEVPADLLARIQETFACGCATDNEARDAIRRVFYEQHYLMDPHTAVAWHVSQNTPKTPGVERVVLSTASPYKFCRDVCEALGLEGLAEADDFACMHALEKEAARIGLAAFEAAPAALANLEGAEVRFDDVLDASHMIDYVERKTGELL